MRQTILVFLFASLLTQSLYATERACGLLDELTAADIEMENTRAWRAYGDQFGFDEYGRLESRYARVASSRRSAPQVRVEEDYVIRRRSGLSWWVERQHVANYIAGIDQSETLIREGDLPDNAFVSSVDCDDTVTTCAAVVSFAGVDASDVWVKYQGNWEKTVFLSALSSARVDSNGDIWVVGALRESELTQSGYPRSLYRLSDTERYELVHQLPDDYVGGQVLEIDQQLVFQGWSTYSQSQFWYADDRQLHRISLPPRAILHGYHKGRWFAVLGDGWQSYPAGVLVGIHQASSGTQRIELLYQPSATQSIESVIVSDHVLWLSVLDNVDSRLFKYDLVSNDRREFYESSAFDHIQLLSATPDHLLLRKQSYTQPPVILSINRATTETKVLARGQPSYDDNSAHVYQFFAESRDGTKIPYFIISRSTQVETRPSLAYVYGGFGKSITPQYLMAAGRLWVDEGGHYVIINARGGQEFGPNWHRAAQGVSKRLTIEDIHAVAKDLVSRGWTNAESLGLRGSSNGGLMALAASIDQPQLYKAVAVSAALTDMLSYRQLGAGSAWSEEYGDPLDPTNRAVLQSYSPLHNVNKASSLTSYFVFHSANDDRVSATHARRFVNQLACANADYAYWELSEGGHSGAATQSDYAKQQLLMYRFFWEQIGGG